MYGSKKKSAYNRGGGYSEPEYFEEMDSEEMEEQVVEAEFARLERLYWIISISRLIKEKVAEEVRYRLFRSEFG
jgi:hypothetical protein